MVETKSAKVSPTEDPEVPDEFAYIVSRPGLSPKYLLSILEAGVKAIIIEGYHSGTLHASTEDRHPNCEYNMVPFLEYARAGRVPVFLTFGKFVGDIDNAVGYEPFNDGFNDGQPGYETSLRLVKAGIIPLKANWQQTEKVCQKMREVLGRVDDYQSIVEEMYAAFPFEAPLERIQAAARK